jgi:hypothetical protein
MTSTIVHVILSGIISLIPQRDGTFLIRLQDARREHAHFPSLLVESRNALAAPPADVQSDEKNPRYLAWLLGNGQITMKGVPDTPLDTSALTNVLRISDACPGENCSTAKASFPTGVEIVARGGSLSVTGLEPYRYAFTNESESRMRWIAEEICWTFEIPTSFLTISVPTPQRGVKQFRIAARSGEDIEIRLQNSLLNDIIPTSQANTPLLDTHVNMYFELSKYPPLAPVYLRPEVEPPMFIHPSHRLAGRQIVRSLTQSPAGMKSTPAVQRNKVPRLNCPPALWDGME